MIPVTPLVPPSVPMPLNPSFPPNNMASMPPNPSIPVNASIPNMFQGSQTPWFNSMLYPDPSMLCPDPNTVSQHVNDEQKKFDKIYGEMAERADKHEEIYQEKLQDYVDDFNDHNSKNQLDLKEAQKIVKKMTALYHVYDQYELAGAVNYANQVHQNGIYTNYPCALSHFCGLSELFYFII